MKKPHILIVEDDAEMRETLSDILLENGYEVETAGEGKESLTLAAKEKFAICLIDLKLPDISGIKVLEEIKHINPGAYAIIMTAFASKETAVGALKAGAYSYIEKPINLEELLHIIKRASASYQLQEEKKQAEGELRKNEEKLKSIFASVTDGIAITDLNANIIDCNQATVDMSGFSSREEIMGRSSFEFIAPKDRQRAKENAMKTLKQGFLKDLEYTCLTKDGYEIPVLMSPSVLRDAHGNPIAFVAVTKDITERKRAEEELEKYMKELERANRDMEDFTSTVSHDLKAPLRTIQAFSLLLMEDYSDSLDETGRDYLNMVKEGVERMNALIEDLLKLSRVGRKFSEVETVDMNELLEEIKSDLSARIEERGGEVVEVGKLPTVSTQRVWLKELFTNLIDNGLKFNKSNKPTVEVSGEEEDKNYLFRVKDNGIGIGEKYQANIFNLFERLHSQSEYEGTGAGLAICKKIVEELGGVMRIESKPGEGSMFFFTMPRN